MKGNHNGNDDMIVTRREAVFIYSLKISLVSLSGIQFEDDTRSKLFNQKQKHFIEIQVNGLELKRPFPSQLTDGQFLLVYGSDR